MSKLVDFLNDVSTHRNDLLRAPDGKNCEELFKSKLKIYFTDMSSSNDRKIISFKQRIKNTILNKNGDSIVDNTLFSGTGNGMYENFFISQPYGSQNYPDFLVFTKYKVFSIEIKYSTKSAVKPMWNSNLPKKDGIYFFGCYELRKLTFFRGEDILSSEERKSLLEIWDKLDQMKKEWDEEFKKCIESKKFDNAYGFEPYIRKAYQQTRNFNPTAITDFFENPNRTNLENKVIEFAENSDK